MPEIITVNEKACKRTFACVEVCPVAIFEKTANGPVAVQNEEDCILCGQCVAVCPNEAISHKRLYMEKFRPVESGKLPKPETVKTLLQTKRSVRAFREDPIPKEILQDLVNIAMQAPAAENQREHRFLVITDKNRILKLAKVVVESYRDKLKLMQPAVRRMLGVLQREKMEKVGDVVSRFNEMLELVGKGEDPIFHNAPAVVCIYAPVNQEWARDNCITAQDYMMLYAHSMGIGSCIVGYVTGLPDPPGRHLGLPAGYRIFSCFTLGYPKFEFVRTVDRPEPMVMWM